MNNVLKISKEMSTRLPKFAKTREGIVYRPRDSVWNPDPLQSSVALNFSKFEYLISSILLQNMKFAFMKFLETKSPAYAAGNMQRIYKLLKVVGTDRRTNKIRSKHILMYRPTLDIRKENDLGGLRAFIKFWYYMKIPGIETDAVLLLQELKLKGPPKGEAVLTLCPSGGPFSELEFKSLSHNAITAFRQKEINESQFLLIWVFSAFALRPIQASQLKCSDLIIRASNSGSKIYFLQVPRAKQRNQIRRTEFKIRPLPIEIGLIMESYINSIHKFHKWPSNIKRDLPLFVDRGNRESGYHFTTCKISKYLQEAISVLNVVSERTLKQLKANPRRIRYTIGTRAASEGASPLVIAEILDHNDTQHVGVYIAVSDKIIERIDKAIATRLGPIIRAFKGEIITDPKDATRALDPYSQIGIQGPKPISVGNCACNSSCFSLAPTSCYACIHFQPWKKAPHKLILDKMIRERNLAFKVDKDETFASIRDLAILACGEVVKKCTG